MRRSGGVYPAIGFDADHADGKQPVRLLREAFGRVVALVAVVHFPLVGSVLVE